MDYARAVVDFTGNLAWGAAGLLNLVVWVPMFILLCASIIIAVVRRLLGGDQ